MDEVRKNESRIILFAEDDEDHFLLTKEALEKTKFCGHLRWVKNGEELMMDLRGDLEKPDLILLDLSMPRMNGHDALKEIKSDPNLRRIPVVILTTSKSAEDRMKSYDLGANSFISRPLDFESLVETIKMFFKYWFEVSQLPA